MQISSCWLCGTFGFFGGAAVFYFVAVKSVLAEPCSAQMAYPCWLTVVLGFVYVSFATATLENRVHDLCGFGDVDETNGTIFLNTTSHTSSELQCSRVIRITKTGRLSLNITNFRIASQDELEIYDGPHSSARKLKNISKPFLFTASGNAIFIRFRGKNGSQGSTSFQASFSPVPYPKKCQQCRRVTNGTLECEDKYEERECRVKCEKGYYDIFSLGTNVTCDMQNEGKWDIDVHERALSCQKVSAPSKIRLRASFNFLNGTCEPLDIQEAFKDFVTSSLDVQKNGKCFADQELNCMASEPVAVRCVNGTRAIDVNITDEVLHQVDLKSGIAKFKDLYNAYGKLDFQGFLNNPGVLNVTINVTSLVEEPIAPLCPDSLSFFKLLITDKENFSDVCSACPVHHFYDTSQCMVCPQGSTAPQGPSSCTNDSKSVHHQPIACDTKCMVGKQYNKNSGFCEWCPYNQYQDSTQTPSQTCKQCPDEKGTPFSGAFNVKQCYHRCTHGTFLNLTDLTGACHMCPLDTYQDQSKHLFTRCRACGNGMHTVAEGSIDGQKCFGPCSTGTFFDEQARNCMKCPMHSYQDKVNQHQCEKCSDGKMTLKPGATNESSCIVPCQAGQSFKMESRRCENCSKGTFQDQSDHLQVTCQACKPTQTTTHRGAKNVTECIITCRAGEFADKKQCQKCPKGYFQELPNQESSCKSCPSGKITQEVGQTNRTACLYLCPAGTFLNSTRKNCSSCPFGTYQDAVDHSLEQCTPCPSEETYVAAGAMSVGSCISNCSMYPCQHGAPCHAKGDGFSCHCGNGLHGKLCEVIENEDKLRRVAMSLHFTSLKWRAELGDHKTHQYHMTKGLIEAVIGEVMVGSDQYVAIEVTDLKEGSVVAYFTLFLTEHSDPIPGRKLQIAAAHGAVGNLNVSSLGHLLQQTCTAALGMEHGYINDDQITASTQHTNAEAREGRLNIGPGWHAMYTRSNEFLQIDFQQMVNITAVASQGMLIDDNRECFVKGYTLGFSDDGKNWIGYPKIDGNNNWNSVVKNYLESPVSARYIRFRPKTWHFRICMRVEVYGCLLDPVISPDDIPKKSPPAITTMVTSSPSVVHTTVLVSMSKSRYGWGAYLGIVVFTLLIVGSVVAVYCWKQKSKRKRKETRPVEQDSLLPLRTSDGMGRYRGTVKTATIPDQDQCEENQV